MKSVAEKLAVLESQLAVAEKGIEVAVESGLHGVIIVAANAHLAVMKDLSAVALEMELAGVIGVAA